MPLAFHYLLTTTDIKMIDLELLRKVVKNAKPGKKIVYQVSTTDWLNKLENQKHIRFFEKIHEEGEWDFLQKKVGREKYGNINVFEYSMTKRRMTHDRYARLTNFF